MSLRKMATLRLLKYRFDDVTDMHTARWSAYHGLTTSRTKKRNAGRRQDGQAPHHVIRPIGIYQRPMICVGAAEDHALNGRVHRDDVRRYLLRVNEHGGR